jgi:Protein of unknown function, DUF481
MRPTLKLISSAVVLVLILPALARAAAPAPQKAPPDALVFTNGDTLTGTFVREVGGKVAFHSNMLGDLEIPWKNIKEIHTGTKLAVIKSGVILKHGHMPANLPVGTLAVSGGLITVHPVNNAMIQPIPVKSAEYIIDQASLQKQLVGHPGILQGWNGAATVGLTLVQATQNQYAFSGALALARVVPTVNWLAPRNRTTLNYAQSYGKITQPAYTDATGTFVPSTYTKSSILHADAERDEYVSPRFYFLGTVAFDHNYSQSLDLQQIYGGGIGYTILKSPVQELDVKAVAQYERQAFFSSTPPPPPSQNLIASTFGGSYIRHITKGIVFTQNLAYIPAWNNLHAYSFNENDTLTLPAYKNFSFSLGTLDTYLNDVPLTYPATKRNSFQFTAGVTYNIKSKY